MKEIEESALHTLLQPQDAAHTLVDAFLADGAVVHCGDDGIERLDKVLRHEHDIHTGLDAAHDSLFIDVLLHDGPHLHIVGNDDVLKLTPLKREVGLHHTLAVDGTEVVAH